MTGRDATAGLAGVTAGLLLAWLGTMVLAIDRTVPANPVKPATFDQLEQSMATIAVRLLALEKEVANHAAAPGQPPQPVRSDVAPASLDEVKQALQKLADVVEVIRRTTLSVYDAQQLKPDADVKAWEEVWKLWVADPGKGQGCVGGMTPAEVTLRFGPPAIKKLRDNGLVAWRWAVKFSYASGDTVPQIDFKDGYALSVGFVPPDWGW